MNQTRLLIATVLGCTASMASASITGTSGACIQISPPALADVPTLMGPLAQVWNEQAGQTGVVFADLTTNPGNSGAPTPGANLFGTFDSHFIHFTGGSAGLAVGTVTFSGPIVMVAWSDQNLDITDGTWGAGGTVYPTGQIGRGMNANGWIWVAGNTLHFDFNAINPAFEIEQVRVWTTPVPAPSAFSLACLGGLMGLHRRRR